MEKKKLDIFISHNKIIIDDITKEDIKNGGKISKGYDDELGEVRILDKDYGKSAELMRYLLEDDSKSKFSLMQIVIGLVGFLLIILIGYSLLSGGDLENETKKGLSIINNQNSNDGENTTDNPLATRDITENREPRIDNTNTSNNLAFQIERNNQPNYESMRKDFEIEQISFELSKSNQERNDFRLKYESEIEKNLILEEKIKTLKKEEEKYSGDKFFYDLGYRVYEHCERTQKEQNINKCKDLYYDYVKSK